jgi:hypothetical protein
MPVNGYLFTTSFAMKRIAVTTIVGCALHDAGGREALLHGLNPFGSSAWRVVAEQRLSGSHGAEAAIDELGRTR